MKSLPRTTGHVRKATENFYTLVTATAYIGIISMICVCLQIHSDGERSNGMQYLFFLLRVPGGGGKVIK